MNGEILGRANIVFGAILDPRGFRATQAEVAKTEASMAGLGKTTDAAGLAASRSFSSRMSSIGSKATSVGKSMSAGLTLPLVAAGAVIGKTAVDFDKAMRNVNSIAQLSEGQFQKLSDQVNSLATETAQSPTTLAEGLYDLVSSGVDASDAMGVLEASAKAATAGLTTTEVATDAVTSVLNAYQMDASKSAMISDVLFRTVDRGKINFETLASSIGYVLPAASSLGVKLPELGAAVATLTKQGQSGEMAMTNLNGAMTALFKPTDEMKAAIKSIGYENAQALIKAKGFEGGLQAIIGTTDGTAESVGKLFGDVRAMRGVFGLTGDNAKMAAEDLKGLNDASGATDRALSQQTKSVAYKMQQLKATLQQLAIELAPPLISALKPVIEILTKLAEWFANLPEPVQKVIVIVGMLVAAIGPLLIVIGSALSSFGAISAALTGVTIAGAPVIAALAAIAAAIAAGIAIGVLIVKNWDKIKAAAKWVWGAIKKIVVAFFDAFKEAAKRGLLGPIGLIITHFETLKRVAGSVFKWMKNAINDAARWIGRAAKNIVGFIVSIPGKIRSGISTLGNIILSPFRWVEGKIKGIIDDVVAWIESLPDKAADAAKSVASSIGGAINPFDGDVVPGLASGGMVGPNYGGPVLIGEGRKDEAHIVVSQEGDRKKNIGLALYALKLLGFPMLARGGVAGAAVAAQRRTERMLSDFDYRQRAFGISGGVTTSDEISRLIHLKREIKRQESRELRLNQRAVSALQNEIVSAQSRAGYAKGKDKEKLESQIDKMSGQLSERRSRMRELPGLIRDLDLDVRDLRNQRDDAREAERQARDEGRLSSPQDALLDRLKTDLALAELTPGTADDDAIKIKIKAALEAQLAGFQKLLAGGGSSTFKEGVRSRIRDIAGELKSYTDAVGGSSDSFTSQIVARNSALLDLYSGGSNVWARPDTSKSAPSFTWYVTEPWESPHQFGRDLAANHGEYFR